MKKTWINQFSIFKETKKKAKENKAKGPVDIKTIRREVNDANAKNRRP